MFFFSYRRVGQLPWAGETIAPMLTEEPQPRKEIFPALESEEVAQAIPVPPFEGTLDGEAHGEEELLEEERKELRRRFQKELSRLNCEISNRFRGSKGKTMRKP